ncbi:MAG: hypothetical protein ACTS6J_09950 [Burkholderiales bacterium]
MAEMNDDRVTAECDGSLTLLNARYWEAHDNPAAGDEVWVLKKQLQDATMEWAKAKTRLLTPDDVTSAQQAEAARRIREQMEQARETSDVIIVAARLIAFVATL